MTHPADIRDAIVARIPHGPRFILNVKVHDGLADVSAQCGATTWQGKIGIGIRDAEEVADDIETRVRDWAKSTTANLRSTLKEYPGASKARRANVGFRDWLQDDPRARPWLDGQELERAA